MREDEGAARVTISVLEFIENGAVVEKRRRCWVGSDSAIESGDADGSGGEVEWMPRRSEARKSEESQDRVLSRRIRDGPGLRAILAKGMRMSSARELLLNVSGEW